jgi:hypothetical protein
MKYISLFSGIEAATVAWEALGFEPVAFAEFEDFPKAVLAHYYPNVPDLGDVTKITKEQIIALGHIDIVVGGSPCQDLSIAGKRAGMKNEDGSTTRSGLFDEQMRIFEIAKEFCGARYMLWENVPGAFSSNGGNDFAYILGSMVGRSVYTPTDRWKNSGICLSEDGGRIVEWRVLDAQYFGVPQRRRRIFALLDTGAWWSRQPILFEQDCMLRHIAACGEQGEGIAEGAEGSVGESCEPIALHPTQDPISSVGKTHCMGTGTKNGSASIAIAVRTAQTGANGIGIATEKSHTLDGANGQAVCYENHANDSRVTRCEGEGAAEGTGNCFTPSSFGGYKAGVGTLRSNGGDLGGGSETIIYENHFVMATEQPIHFGADS